MDVLLVNPANRADLTAGHYRGMLAPMPPISLAYIAASLEAAGVRVRVVDEGVGAGPWGSLEQALRAVRPDVVGLSVVTQVMPDVERVVREVRAVSPSTRVVLGNLHASLYAEPLLRAGLADVVVHGEGDLTIVDVVAELSRPAPDLARVLGISFLEGDELRTTAMRPYIQDLDALPFPAWHLFPMERYRLFAFARVRDPGGLIQGSRGCPYRCSFCSLVVMGSTRRRRSAASIADECEYLYDRFGVVQPSFVDAIFPLGKKEGLDYAAELIRRGLHRKQVWITETRTDRVDLELLQALRESGLRRIMYGLETRAPAELAGIRKEVAADSGEEAVRLAHAAGIGVIGFFMLGIPGATRATLNDTIAYASSLGIDFAKFTVFVPFPGTAVHGELAAAGELCEPENWRRYTSYPTRENPPVYVPRGLTADDLIRAQRKAYAAFYLRPGMIARQLLRVRTLKLDEMLQGAWSLVRSLH